MRVYPNLFLLAIVSPSSAPLDHPFRAWPVALTLSMLTCIILILSGNSTLASRDRNHIQTTSCVCISVVPKFF